VQIECRRGDEDFPRRERHGVVVPGGYIVEY
jgi:hypothetical protein